jgi:HK97 family phage portal protein
MFGLEGLGSPFSAPYLRQMGGAGGVVVNPAATQAFITPPTLLASLGLGVTKPYSQNIWVYACVNAIADNIAAVPLNFFTGTAEQKKPFSDDSLVNFSNSPNPYMSLSDLTKAILTWLGLQGEAFCILDRDNPREFPKEVWCFDPGRFKEVSDKKTGLIIGWIYNRQTTRITLEPYEVLFIRYFNPYNDIRGLSPLAAGQKSVDQDSYAAEYNMRFFQNSASPGGVLQTKDNISEEDYHRIRDQWNAKHQGLTKAFTIAVLEGGLEYKPIGYTQKESDYLGGRKLNREEILACYNVPPEAIGLEPLRSRSLNANSDTPRKIFWESCLLPKMTLLEYCFWSQIFSQLTGPRIWAEFDRKSIAALQDDFNTQLDRATKLFAMGYSKAAINDRLDLGMPPMADDNVGYLPVNMIPTAEAGKKPAVPAPEEGKSITQVIFPPSLQITGPGPEIIARRKLARRTSWQQYNQLQTTFERKFQPRMKRYFYDQRKEQLRLVEQNWGKFIRLVRASDDQVDDLLFDLEAWNANLKKISWQFYQTVGAEAGKGIMLELGADPASFILADTPAIEVLKTKLIKVVAINDITREKLRDTLMEGMGKLETVAELQDRVREVYNFSESRSLTIARTETGQAATPARDAAMKMLGVERQEWTTAGDDKVREIHAEMDGEIVDLGDAFSNGLLYPCDPSGDADEVINCRCCAAPVVEKD